MKRLLAGIAAGVFAFAMAGIEAQAAPSPNVSVRITTDKASGNCGFVITLRNFDAGISYRINIALVGGMTGATREVQTDGRGSVRVVNPEPGLVSSTDFDKSVGTFQVTIDGYTNPYNRSVTNTCQAP